MVKHITDLHLCDDTCARATVGKRKTYADVLDAFQTNCKMLIKALSILVRTVKGKHFNELSPFGNNSAYASNTFKVLNIVWKVIFTHQ